MPRAANPGGRIPSLKNRSRGLQFGFLAVVSIVCFALLEAMHLPAALLLGPMAAAIILAAFEGSIRVPLRPFFLAQALVGCLIARSIQPQILHEMAVDWPLFLVAILGVLVAANALGGLLTRFRVLPDTTAIWGSSPGAATAMVLMAEAFGADVRLVAFMQYLRVVFVAIAASLVSRLWVSSTGQLPEVVWFPPVDWIALVETIAIAAVGVVIARRFKVPAGPLLVPMVIAVLLQDFGFVTIELPPWLLAASYLLVGWSIGLRFTRPILAHAARAFPRVAGSIIALIIICGGFAWLLVHFAGIDPLTAYLATSPGGADSVAIIAASSKVDLPFVMALQTGRFLVVLFTGPAVARFIANRINAGRTAREPAAGE